MDSALPLVGLPDDITRRIDKWFHGPERAAALGLLSNPSFSTVSWLMTE